MVKFKLYDFFEITLYNIIFIRVRYKSDRSRKIHFSSTLECFAEKDRSHAAPAPLQLKYFSDQKFINLIIYLINFTGIHAVHPQG